MRNSDPALARGQDPTLVGDPFESRLAGYEPKTRARPDAATPPPAKLVAGRYELRQLIGEGSMGRIFLAEQVSVGRRVAIKIINRELSAKFDTIARFQQEARLLASVKNEHIVDIYDIGETETGDPFIAMEYVDGPSLAQTLREHGPMEPARVIRLLLQVASALATVHEAGVVHRDLKPANIVLLRLAAGAELVKILDFGLAKVLSDREATGRLTRTGTIVGTPEYMSPEQVAGGHVDHRADIYGFGCTAYEMASGQPPFTGAEVATLYKHMHEPVPPLSKLRPGLPLPLARVIHRCLEKQPKDRYPSARELHAALVHAADESGIARAELRAPRSGIDQAPDASWLTGSVPLPPRRRRREVVLIAATALVLGLIGGVLVDRALGGGGDGPPAGASTGAGASPAVPVAPGRGVLLVTTVPAGAEVSVEGAAPGPSPFVARDLPRGTQHVKVRGRGWMPQDQDIEIAGGQLTELVVKLERPRYALRIESHPSGATVTLDGKELGETPLDASLTQLEFHELSFRRDGYRARDMFLAPDHKEPRLEVTLNPVLLHSGSVIVNSEHPGRVIVDGQDTGEWTPTGELQLTPGRHTIELVDNLNLRRKITVNIVQGALVNVDVPAPKGTP